MFSIGDPFIMHMEAFDANGIHVGYARLNLLTGTWYVYSIGRESHWDTEQEARIAVYAERAERQEPLFSGPVHLPAQATREFLAVPKVISASEFRTCRICNRLLPLEDFPRQHYFRKCDGARVPCRGNRCKDCTNEYFKDWCRRKRARLREEEAS